MLLVEVLLAVMAVGCGVYVCGGFALHCACIRAPASVVCLLRCVLRCAPAKGLGGSCLPHFAEPGALNPAGAGVVDAGSLGGVRDDHRVRRGFGGCDRNHADWCPRPTHTDRLEGDGVCEGEGVCTDQIDA